MTSSELERWLKKQGATFESAKNHQWVMLNGRRTVMPVHGSSHDLKRGTVDAIKKQLGLK